jgi:hypothetical protein
MLDAYLQKTGWPTDRVLTAEIRSVRVYGLGNVSVGGSRDTPHCSRSQHAPPSRTCRTTTDSRRCVCRSGLIKWVSAFMPKADLAIEPFPPLLLATLQVVCIRYVYPAFDKSVLINVELVSSMQAWDALYRHIFGSGQDAELERTFHWLLKVSNSTRRPLLKRTTAIVYTH